MVRTTPEQAFADIDRDPVGIGRQLVELLIPITAQCVRRTLE